MTPRPAQPRYILIVTYNNGRQRRLRFHIRADADKKGRELEKQPDVMKVEQDRAY